MGTRTRHVAIPAVEPYGDRHYGLCGCGWKSPLTDDYKEAAQWCVEHSDPDDLEEHIRNFQITFPHMTREQILGLED